MSENGMRQPGNARRRRAKGNARKTARTAQAPLAEQANAACSSQPAAEPLPLCLHIDQLIESLRVHIADAVRGDEEAVHDARVATRRLKAAADLTAPVVRERH